MAAPRVELGGDTGPSTAPAEGGAQTAEQSFTPPSVSPGIGAESAGSPFLAGSLRLGLRTTTCANAHGAMRNGLGRPVPPEAVRARRIAHVALRYFWNSFTYSPYPCAASSRTGMNRIDAEFMQYRSPVGRGPSSNT